MKFLLIAKQKKNADTFGGVISQLLAWGHEVALALQDRDEARDAKLLDQYASPSFSLLSCPASRSDEWLAQAPLVRRLRDWVQYQGPKYVGATKLRARVTEKLHDELGSAKGRGRDQVAGLLDEAQAERLTALLARVEASIPSDPLHEEFISRQQPDAVLVTPGVAFGSAQADFVKSARAAGVPVWMLLFSWDNLSTKGALHVFPDLMFVWNERQRREAVELHQYPADRVVAAGAPRFDEFFSLQPALSRNDFFAPLGLDPAAPMVLYVCSSEFVSQHELPFVRRWLSTLRSSSHPSLASCNVVIRPHPDISLLGHENEGTAVDWAGLRHAAGTVIRPFGDDKAIVLTTSGKTPQPFFECLFHSAAVVGLNTSAALEAGIIGRPVLTVLAEDEAVTGQANTLHFRYLLRDEGGFVQLAPDLPTHAEQLRAALAQSPDDEHTRSFVRDFLRPSGDRPAALVLADALVEQLTRSKRQDVFQLTPAVPSPLERVSLESAVVTRWEPSKILRLSYPGSGLRVWATRETRKERRAGHLVLDEATVRWLDEHVQPGDVVYDVGAGIGAYALVTAVHRGALVVAFEPDASSYKRLCDNLLLNDCRRRILPIPIALGRHAGLFELGVRAGSGKEDERGRSRPWRNRPDGTEWRHENPVCVEPLDEIVARHQLPRANHIRLAVPHAAEAVLLGAAESLRPRSLRSVLVATDADSSGSISNLLETAGLAPADLPGADGQRRTLVFLHATVSAPPGTVETR
jgi:FkbM family methyltransferase